MEQYCLVISSIVFMWAFWIGVLIGRKTKPKSAIELVYEEAKKGGADKLLVDLKR